MKNSVKSTILTLSACTFLLFSFQNCAPADFGLLHAAKADDSQDPVRLTSQENEEKTVAMKAIEGEYYAKWIQSDYSCAVSPREGLSCPTVMPSPIELNNILVSIDRSGIIKVYGMCKVHAFNFKVVKATKDIIVIKTKSVNQGIEPTASPVIDIYDPCQAMAVDEELVTEIVRNAESLLLTYTGEERASGLTVTTKPSAQDGSRRHLKLVRFEAELPECGTRYLEQPSDF
jgi:hypothetical protein